ncbi:MAG: hypothetical protein GWN18_05065, partial [Thermoplasmata archaeon]|nr:hypothetical protein [Thermoplasmata archaeon]NIS11400.1 hypothetical protein [Thermoplasmata archaeon]NIS19336.1 hypothetical protein [Thermoplasmata archaeon]NIT76428.1 hypothetical protein [Thermoplasmata archaeon]NIU48464.1 hypothetical protein [Thermoplasmata archaeon]
KELEDLMDTVGGRIGTPEQYQGFAYTHEVSDINAGVRMSAYKRLGKMIKKMDAQFDLGS